MEIRLKTGKLTDNITIPNTYAPGRKYEFSEISERREQHITIYNLPNNLIKCWCADNNGLPQHTDDNNTFIGK